MQLLLVRHAQSANNAVMEDQEGGEVGRVPDPGLTPLGERQARALADWLPSSGLRPTRLCTSLMRRTIQTALPIAERLGLPIETRLDAFEAGGPYVGTYASSTPHRGSTRTELAGLSPAVVLPAEVTDEGWWAGPVETASAALRRACTVADWLGQQPDACLVLVSHGAIGSMLLTALLHREQATEVLGRDDLGAEDLPAWYTLDNTATSLLTLTPGGQTTVGWVNRVDHLLAAGDHTPSRITYPFPPARTPVYAPTDANPREL